MSQDSLTADSYQVLKQRLNQAASDLRARFDRLNADRANVFGTVETKLVSTTHVATDHNCTPRDIFSCGSRLLLGYNVQFGLQSEVHPKDVFSLFRLEGEIAHQDPLSEWMDPRFERDFAELYRYYKKTTFLRFHVQGPNLFMIFQVGKSDQDIKSFKWVIESGRITYVDNRSDAEIKLPDQHGFPWNRVTRDQHRAGLHPHISIQDLVYVECVGGDLTVKVEDNTETGSGIYSEPVENSDQTLDDAEIAYSVLGNLVLLRIRPYQEKEYRFLAFSIKRQQAMRLDGIRRACALLPDDHGLIFPSGILLQTGESKIFDHGLTDLDFLQMRPAPNGEDFLYLFYQPHTGIYLQFRYNLIRQQVDTPLVCHGQTTFDDGRMVTMRAQETPQKHHALQIWQTPFVGPNEKPVMATESMLYKIGNRDLVRCMAECQEVLSLIDRDESYAGLYVDLTKLSSSILDSYFWLDREETHQLNLPIQAIRDAATAAIDEFERVVRLKKETASAFAKTASECQELMKATERSRFESVDEFTKKLGDFRHLRGSVIGLRELKYIDLSAVDQLDQKLIAGVDDIGRRCVQFMLNPESFQPYHLRLADSSAKVALVTTVAQGRELEAALEKTGSELELLMETISILKIDDLTQRTAIVDRTGDLLAELNQVRSSLRAHVRQLLSGEMEAEFGSQMKLLDQAASGILETANTPEKVDQAVTKTMLQLEELESRFAEFDELLLRLHEKREGILEAFESRRVQLVEARTKRADSLAAAADRVLQSIASRTHRIDEPDALRAFLAADPMVDKARRVADQLKELGDAVRMEDVLSRLKAIGDDAFRQQRDRKDLYSGGNQLIRLGNHQFAVNQQTVELTTVLRDSQLWLHITGTQFFEALKDADLEEARDLWDQALVSETSSVYRAEYLAARLRDELEQSASGDSSTSDWFLGLESSRRLEWVREKMQVHHAEGYARGVHDRDASTILAAWLERRKQLGLLRFPPEIRSVAWYVWQHLVPKSEQSWLENWVKSFSAISSFWSASKISASCRQSIAASLNAYGQDLLSEEDLEQASDYLIEQWQQEPERPVVSQLASLLVDEMVKRMPAEGAQRIREVLKVDRERPKVAWLLALDAVDGFLQSHHVFQNQNLANQAEKDDPKKYRYEAARLLIDHGPAADWHSLVTQSASPVVSIENLAGDHVRLNQGKVDLHLHDLERRIRRHRIEIVPRFEKLRSRKHQLLEVAWQRLRVHDMGAKVLTSFVRNRLIDQVFLPRIGDNLAKQLGATGENKRTDRMGLLLLISPPGYGKTTLMEYVANRLGLIFMKINGPALGHDIKSLDPSEAKNASAKEEVRRINLALEMGDNVMLYLDDIQHCHTEFLQKFIPLCDATRRIEGVWNEQSKAYDLRGRRFAVVMAGNPYTESGELFRIPDMLANRADVYNLGEMIGGAVEAFEMSYLENCLTSNTYLSPLARASTEDQQKLILAAGRGAMEGISLQANFTPDQLSEMSSVIKKLIKVRDVVLTMNREYIRSAAQVDQYRVEPPFKLQGSYRNMNRIAEKISPVMNDQEVMTTILSSYEQEAQTLTRDSESNLLKFRELLGILSDEQKKRWESIRYAYVESIRMAGFQGDDQATQILKSLFGLKDGLEGIRRTIVEAASGKDSPLALGLADGIKTVEGRLQSLEKSLGAAVGEMTDKMALAQERPVEQKVLVQHSVPRVITDLVKSQFQLLYDGLRPILEELVQQSGNRQRLGQAMNECLEKYQELASEVDSAENDRAK